MSECGCPKRCRLFHDWRIVSVSKEPVYSALAEARREAWDEGYNAHWRYVHHAEPLHANPYAAGEHDTPAGDACWCHLIPNCAACQARQPATSSGDTHEHHEATPLPQLCDVRGDRCCGTPACLNAGKWSAQQPAGPDVDTAAIRADHADPAWSRKHGCAAALRLCDALDAARAEIRELRAAYAEKTRLLAEQYRNPASARLDEIRALWDSRINRGHAFLASTEDVPLLRAILDGEEQR